MQENKGGDQKKGDTFSDQKVYMETFQDLMLNTVESWGPVQVKSRGVYLLHI